jgi:hypothetical protein
MPQNDDANLRLSTEAFVRLSKLTVVLSNVLDSFYLVHRNPRTMSPEEALSHAGDCQAKLRECLSEGGSVLLQPSRVINGVFKRSDVNSKIAIDMIIQIMPSSSLIIVSLCQFKEHSLLA